MCVCVCVCVCTCAHTFIYVLLLPCVYVFQMSFNSFFVTSFNVREKNGRTLHFEFAMTDHNMSKLQKEWHGFILDHYDQDKLQRVLDMMNDTDTHSLPGLPEDQLPERSNSVLSQQPESSTTNQGKKLSGRSTDTVV